MRRSGRPRSSWLVGLTALLLAAGAIAGCAAMARPTAGHGTAVGRSAITADEALARLEAGNGRFRSGHLEHPDQELSRRLQVEAEQHPYAVVVSCSDSRVPPEIVFDEGLGDLFVVREAGHVADAATLGSVEYAVEHLGVHLIVVLGHDRCGAVSTAVEAIVHKARPEGHMLTLVDAIAPALARVQTAGGDVVARTVRANVDVVVESLRASRPILADRVASGELRVVGGVYDLHTGAVEWR
jgi:carbonic anhydrase